jgi:hypothetical protein
MASTLPQAAIEVLKKYIPMVLNYLPLFTYTFDTDFIFERVVINQQIANSENRRLTNIENIKYPPLSMADKIGYNRANLKGQSIFYAGASGLLAVNIETKPKRGQLVTTSKWQLKKNEKINVFVVCQDIAIVQSHFYQIEYYYNHFIDTIKELHFNTSEVVEAIYKFITKAFLRKVNPSNRQEYLFSALIADYLFTQTFKPIDAIYYPSVQVDSSMNIAIKPNVLEEKFDFHSAKESLCLMDPQDNTLGWLSHTTAECLVVDDNKLIWQNQPIPGLDAILREYKVIF